MSTPAEAPQEESFLSHLIELRTRLVRAAIAVVVAFLALAPFTKTIFELLSAPLTQALPVGTKLLATGVITPFMVPVKVTLLVAFVIALPVVLYQAWAFIAPGLYAHERKFAMPIVLSGFILFLCGMAFCYFFVFGVVFKAMVHFAPDSVSVAPDIEQYFSFVLGMFVAFGLTFEVPIVVVVLVRFGIVEIAKLKEIRPYVVVGAFVVAAIVTPPDVVSQLMLAIPLCLLYEIGIQASRFVTARKRSDPDIAD
ncbi:twin-arginine translocase subunit TatC [soil metagenome]